MSHDDYELDAEDRPGVCFGASIVTNTAGEIDINYHFEDQDERLNVANIPSQQYNVVADYIRAPNTDAFERYSERGFLYL